MRAIALVLLLAGCATHVINPMRPNANFEADSWECERQANAMVPPVKQQQPSSYSTNCQTYGANTNCTTTADDGLQQTQANNLRLIQVIGAKNRCLAAKGWVKG